jgi:hypothetical protein
MGLFSKFNVRAVDQAYKDLVALQFVSLVAVQTLDSCEYGGSRVDVGPICDEVGLAIGKSLYDNADGGLELGAAIQRLDIVSSSIKRDLIEKFGHDHSGDEIARELHSRFEAIAPKLLKAAKKGYLKFSIMDAVNLVERYEEEIGQALYRALDRGNDYSVELERRIEEENSEQFEKEHRSPKEFVERLYQTIEAEMDAAGKAKKVADEEEEDTNVKWLRGEWEYLQRKRAKGQQLDDYEKGLEKKYKESQETDS